MKPFTLLFIFLLIASCTSNTIYEKPKNLIPKDTMIALIADMMVASSAKNIKNLHLQKAINYMPLVYNKYKIDSARFMESNIYYLSIIEGYEEMLKEVKIRLEKEHKKYADSVKILDSITRNERNKRIEQAKKRLEKEQQERKLPVSK